MAAGSNAGLRCGRCAKCGIANVLRNIFGWFCVDNALNLPSLSGDGSEYWRGDAECARRGGGQVAQL
jgi:hypothetical protein